MGRVAPVAPLPELPEPAVECPTRERRSALIAICIAFLLAALVIILSLLSSTGGVGTGPATGMGLGPAGTSGAGNATGPGLGSEAGPGAALAGTGAGAGSAGDGAGTDPDAPPRPPAGSSDGDSPPEDAAVDAGNLSGGAKFEPPTFGFTPEDDEKTDAPMPEPEPEDDAPETPSPRVPVGSPRGRPSSGSAGAGGGGGGEAQVANVIDNFPNSRVTINLDATSSMQSSRDALAKILPDLFARLESGSIAVMVFRDIEMGEANEAIIKRTRRTLNKRAIDSMIEKILAIPLTGGGDTPETGYQLVISNIKDAPRAAPNAPNVEIIITDAPEKQAYLLKELRERAKDKNTRVFNILTASSPPTHTELTDPPKGSKPVSPAGTRP
jgi:hypothetical protein